MRLTDTIRSLYVLSLLQDDTAFEKHYDGITAHLDQLIRVAKQNKEDYDGAGGLLTYGLYSDWCPPEGCGGFSGGTKEEDPSGLCPPTHISNSQIVSSFYYIQQLRIMTKVAARLGRHEDAARYGTVLAPLPAGEKAVRFPNRLMKQRSFAKIGSGPNASKKIVEKKTVSRAQRSTHASSTQRTPHTGSRLAPTAAR